MPGTLLVDDELFIVCLCLCRFLSRPDVKALKMAEFLDWALKVVSMSDSTCVHSLSLHPVFLPA